MIRKSFVSQTKLKKYPYRCLKTGELSKISIKLNFLIFTNVNITFLIFKLVTLNNII